MFIRANYFIGMMKLLPDRFIRGVALGGLTVGLLLSGQFSPAQTGRSENTFQADPLSLSHSLLKELQGQMRELRQRLNLLAGENQRLTQRLEAQNQSLLEQRRIQDQLEQALQSLQQANRDCLRRRALPDFEALTQSLGPLLDAHPELILQRFPDHARLQLGGALLYPPGEAALVPSGRRVLEQLARLIKPHFQIENPPLFLEIHGHTDNQPLPADHPHGNNWQLSAMRALNVLTHLREQGLPAGRLAAIAHGASRPLVSNADPDGRARNRRLGLWFVGGVPGHPPPETQQ